MAKNQGDQPAFAVISNTDLTEGRGAAVILHVCRFKETAERLAQGAGVQGSPARVEKAVVFKRAGVLYGPIDLVQPDEGDKERHAARARRDQAVREAADAGLSDDQIAALIAPLPPIPKPRR